MQRMILQPRSSDARISAFITAALAVALGACGSSEGRGRSGGDDRAVAAAPSAIAGSVTTAPARTIGLFTSLPILWDDAAEIGELLASGAPPHWARQVLEQNGALRPIDALAHGAPGAASPLAGVNVLVMAQPRPLSPQENVALDDWVRAGGRVLLFADPLLTEDSAFALGDKRRPQDVIMMSPILARWGLRLTYDDDQPAGLRAVRLPVGETPVDSAGGFVAESPAGGCRIDPQAILAECAVGAGRVVAMADVALLERESADFRGFASVEARRNILKNLVALAAETDG